MPPKQKITKEIFQMDFSDEQVLQMMKQTVSDMVMGAKGGKQ